MCKYSRHYIRAGQVPVERVLPYIALMPGYMRWYLGHRVHMTSSRLRLFQQAWKAGNLRCVSCGIEGRFFSVERMKNTRYYHLNLYGTAPEGHRVLITKDHIVPKSKGGRNLLSNLQVMCAYCNNAKGDSHVSAKGGPGPQQRATDRSAKNNAEQHTQREIPNHV